MHPIALEYLTVFAMHPARHVELAARTGFRAVGLNLSGGANPIGDAPRFDLRHDPALREQVAQALRATGIGLPLVEGFAITPDSDVVRWTRHLDWAASAGARAICAVSLERDRSRSCDQFASLTELARQRGMRTTTEIGAGILKNLDRALQMVGQVADPAFSLLIDTMHFFRSGGTLDQLAMLDPGLIGHVQLCDVPMPALAADYMDEALNERRIPGEGDLPLAEFVRRIPRDIPIGLEVPMRSRLVRGRVDEDVLRLCLKRARGLVGDGDGGEWRARNDSNVRPSDS